MEQLQTAEDQPDPLQKRRLIISGLAMAVPQFLSRSEAAEQLSVWFPEDQLALTALHRQISYNQKPIAA